MSWSRIFHIQFRKINRVETHRGQLTQKKHRVNGAWWLQQSSDYSFLTRISDAFSGSSG
jgi:hypothetical protein